MLGTIQATSYNNGHALIDFINQLADVSTFNFNYNRFSRNLSVVVMTMHLASSSASLHHDLVTRKHDLMNDQFLSFSYTCILCKTSMKRIMNNMIFTSADGRANKDERCVQYLFKYSITVALYCSLSACVSRSMTHCIIPSPWLCNVLTAAQHGSLLGGSLRVFDAMM